MTFLKFLKLTSPAYHVYKSIVQPGYYKKVDKFFGGFLPGGYSRIQYRADRTNAQALTILEEAKAEKLKSEAEITRDLYDKTFWEKIGIGYSPVEKQVQDNLKNLQAQAMFNAQQDRYIELQKGLLASQVGGGIIPVGSTTPIPVSIPSPEGTKSFNWSSLTMPLIVIGGIIVASNMTKNKK